MLRGEELEINRENATPEELRVAMDAAPNKRSYIRFAAIRALLMDGKQERYLSYYGIRRSILDGATLEVYYELRTVPLATDEKPLSVSFEQSTAVLSAAPVRGRRN